MGFHDFAELETGVAEVRDAPVSKAFDPDKLVTREVAQERGDDPGRNAGKSFDPDKLVVLEGVQERGDDPGHDAEKDFDPDKLVVPDEVDLRYSGVSERTGELGESLDAGEEIHPKSIEAESVERPPETNDKYHDDVGNVIREGDRLLPNTEYIKNGYRYETDALSRTTSAEGELRISAEGRKRINDSMMAVSKGESWLTDERGHLIANMFGGSADLSNLVAMDGRVNHREYLNVENRCLSALREGKQVYMRTEVQYKGNSHRPSGFTVTTIIDGEKTITRIGNRSEGSIKC